MVGVRRLENGRMTERERRAYEAHVRAEGFCVVEGFFPREKLLRWRDALLALLRERITEGTASARGHQRYYAIVAIGKIANGDNAKAAVVYPIALMVIFGLGSYGCYLAVKYPLGEISRALQ